MDVFPVGAIDYESICARTGDCSPDEKMAFLLEELPYEWLDAYTEVTPEPRDVVRFCHGAFEYVFDCEQGNDAPGGLVREARLVAAFGQSQPHPRARDDYRLKGWVGTTESTFGKEWDKGHFIAHSIGGAVEGVEANVFVQRRDVNRGWSEDGKRYRAMEKHCASNPGTFCFSRPIYTDQSARPAFLEFGILTSDCMLWVERFDNQ